MSDDFDTKLADLRQQLLETARSLIRRLRGPGILLDGSDLVQLVMLQAHLNRLLWECGDKELVRQLKTILKYEFKHAVRYHSCRKRDRAHERPLWADDAETLSDRQPSPVEQAEQKEFVDRLESVLPGLPPSQREVIRAHFLEGGTFAEIAARLGRSRATITVRFQQGIEKIKEMLHLTDER